MVDVTTLSTREQQTLTLSSNSSPTVVPSWPT